MTMEKYAFVKRSDDHYDFISEGPNGNIIKMVEFFKLPESESEIFNLGFGDWDEAGVRFDDQSISNNSDRDKILGTVASTVIDFMQHHPNVFIAASGSTPSRTRLYQMSIAKTLDEINERFEIDGWINEAWQPFQKGVNYKRFLLKNKQYSNN
jgi:hypothetical protein